MTNGTRLRFVAHGVGIEIRTDSPEILESALSYLPPLRTPLDHAGPVARTFHLHSGAMAELNTLEWEVHRFLAETAPDRIFVHAGVVEWRGRAIVVPGRSHSGKSTLVAAFVRAGCAYLSDEYAILDSNGFCHSHPRPLALRVDGRVDRRTVQELGGHTGKAILPIGCVVITRYRAGATWQPEAVSPGRAAMALLNNTVAIRARSGEALAALRASVAAAEAYDSVRGDAAETASALLSQLSASSRPTRLPSAT